MPKSAHPRRSAKSRRAELERRLLEIRSQESTIKQRIYKLEASIAAAPGWESGRRLRLWNTVAADEAPARDRDRRPRTRYQRQLENRERSRQALTALLLAAIAVILGLCLSWQLKSHGLL